MAEEPSRVILTIEAHASGHVAGETKGRIHISVTQTVVTATILGIMIIRQLSIYFDQLYKQIALVPVEPCVVVIDYILILSKR